MQVLSVASECAPLVKTGGLADVVGALPEALAAEGVGVRTLLPGYPDVITKAKGKVVHKWQDLFGGPARLREAKVAGLDLYLLDAPHLFDREGGPYSAPGGLDWPDNAERFAALSYAAAMLGDEHAAGWEPDLIHCHDWQAALTPYYLKVLRHRPTPVLMTIHNMAFLGLAPPDRLDALQLRETDFTRDGFEFWGQISMLKAGLVWADHISTVSPTYAAELLREEFGAGLHGVIQSRRADLSGILNGIDEDVWNPATDPHIQAYKTAKGKARNRAKLRKIMGLPEAEGPLCVVVSRLSHQKGLDLLLDALPALTSRGGQLALLGSGDPALERAFHAAAADLNVAVRIGYDEVLAHQLIAGGDAILIPSRFEPCGLTQLYGLRYGTIPVVALTGGLADTVITASPAALARGVATGLQFHPVTADALALALDRLCNLFQSPDIWAQLQKNAMAQPVGWGPSARAYADLMKRLMNAP